MKRLSDQTLYEILEVEPEAPAPEISAAYERARAIYGPGSLATYSLMTPDEAELLTARIEEAGRTLLDPEARSRYDRSLTSPDAGELRAAVNAHGGGHANGTNGVSGSFTLPPVIPALQPAEPSPAPPAERTAPREVEAPPPPVEVPPVAASRPPPGGEVAPPPPSPAPAPIRLDREIRPPEPPPPAAPPPEPAPAPAAAPPPGVEVPLPEGSVWTGEALRRVREARGISVAQIAERTKVTRHHVENVEADRFSSLPAPVYLRGILLSLARELRLDGQKVARSYLDRVAAAPKK